MRRRHRRRRRCSGQYDPDRSVWSSRPVRLICRRAAGRACLGFRPCFIVSRRATWVARSPGAPHRGGLSQIDDPPRPLLHQMFASNRCTELCRPVRVAAKSPSTLIAATDSFSRRGRQCRVLKSIGVLVPCAFLPIRLGGGYDYDSTGIRPRYDHSTTYVTIVGGLLH